jgi:hypothetical protein
VRLNHVASFIVNADHNHSLSVDQRWQQSLKFRRLIARGLLHPNRALLICVYLANRLKTLLESAETISQSALSACDGRSVLTFGCLPFLSAMFTLHLDFDHFGRCHLLPDNCPFKAKIGAFWRFHVLVLPSCEGKPGELGNLRSIR